MRSKHQLCFLLAGCVLILFFMKYAFSNIYKAPKRSLFATDRVGKAVNIEGDNWFNETLSKLRESEDVKHASLVAEGSDVVSDKSVEVLVYRNSNWQQADVCVKIDTATYKDDFFRLSLMSPVGRIPVFIHDPARDSISNSLYKQRRFDPRLLELILLFVLSDDDISFIDVGANIGLHTLPVLKVGRKVLSFEAVPSNMQHICMSINDLQFSKNSKLIHNVIGANHNLTNVVHRSKGTNGDNPDPNITKNQRNTDRSANRTYAVSIPTVMLDDLLSWPNDNIKESFNKNFYRIDVQGSEDKVLEGAKAFLKNTKTVGILIKWQWHRGLNSGKTIYNILTSLDFEPFDPTIRNLGLTKPTRVDFHEFFSEKLFFINNAGWPSDVVWIPR